MILNRSIVPSLFTMLNLFFGFFAIVNAVHDKFVPAAWFIILAAVWDAADGKIARKTKTYSEFGVQFDSISDIVSFGMAPSFLIYKVYFYKLDAVGVILSFLPLLFGAIRLARFNVNQDGFEKENFLGMPIPVMACTIATYVMFHYDLWDGLRYAQLLIPLVLFLCFLMVSHVEYEMLPRFSFREGRRNSILFTLVLAASIGLVVFRQKAMFPMIFSFVLYFFFKSVLHIGREEESEDEVYL